MLVLPRSRCLARFALFAFLALAALAALVPSVSAQGADTSRDITAGRRPKLVVLISIDQFRADYLRRLVNLYLPPHPTRDSVGGFRYLMESGSDFLDARHQHYPLFTGPGHAVLLTGGYPYKTGIVANDWWDRKTHQPTYCVDDARWKVVGALQTSSATPMGPLHLQSTTVGDELKLATAGRARVVTLSLKDRAAILLGGHMQDACLWFDTEGGRWISSTAYCKDGKLPDWAEAVNRDAIPDKVLGTMWRPSVTADEIAKYSFSPAVPETANPAGLGRLFPHAIGPEKTARNYTQFTYTPEGNDFVFETAERAVAAAKLGQREVPDLLAFNLATNDYVGHAFGPYSPEALDVAVRTDRGLSGFLNFLNRTVDGGLGNVIVVVSADHGVAPVPEDSEKFDLIPSGRTVPSAVPEAIAKALSAKYGDDAWVEHTPNGRESAGLMETFSYLSDEAVERALDAGKAASRDEIEETARRAVLALHLPGYYDVYTRAQILSRALPDTDLARHLANATHPYLSGDLILLDDQLHLSYSAATNAASHGTPYAYDTHVPLLISGFDIAHGAWADPVSPADIAPTLCTLLGIEFPSACDGRILKSALR